MPALRAAVVGMIVCGAVGACASAPPPAEPAAPAESTRPEAAAQPSAERQTTWSGSFAPMQERTGYAAPTKKNQAYGTIRLQPSARDLNRTKVNIVLSTPLQDPTQLRWALLPGRCGGATLPVVGYEHFPSLEVGTNGRGELTTEIPLAMPYEGSFHVNIYWGERSQPGSARLQDVMTCANLRRGA